MFFKKIIILAVLAVVLFAISFNVLADSDADVAGVINSIEIQKDEIDIARKDFEAYYSPSSNVYNADDTPQINPISDMDFLKGIAKRRLTEELFVEHNITLSQEELSQVHAYFDETMSIIYEQSNSEVEEERQAGLMMLQCMENAAKARNMSMDEYKDNVCIKEHEYMRKKDKLIKSGFGSLQVLEEYLANEVDKQLEVKNIE